LHPSQTTEGARRGPAEGVRRGMAARSELMLFHSVTRAGSTSVSLFFVIHVDAEMGCSCWWTWD